MSTAFTKTEKTIAACHPRSTRDSTVLSHDRLSLVYTLYQVSIPPNNDKPLVNLVFCAGNVSNRAIWYYHIEQLISRSSKAGSPFLVNSAITYDRVNQGDACILNEPKLGIEFKWHDGARDMLEIVRHELEDASSCFGRAGLNNVAIGHSMGGYEALCASCISPELFVANVLFEPVVHLTKEHADGFTMVLPRIYDWIQTDFDNEEAYERFWSTKSFHRKFHKTTMRDFLALDKFVLPDGRIRNKTSKEESMVNYSDAPLAVKWLEPLLQHNNTPTLHVVAGRANWNPPDTDTYLTSRMPRCEAITVENAIHSINCDEADMAIDMIYDTIVNKGLPEIEDVKRKDERNAAQDPVETVKQHVLTQFKLRSKL